MSDVKIKPVGDKVLVKFNKDEEQERGGIFIPDSAKEKPQEATVIAIGSKVDPLILGEGNIVLTGKFTGIEIKSGNEMYKIYNTDDILAIIC